MKRKTTGSEAAGRFNIRTGRGVGPTGGYEGLLNWRPSPSRLGGEALLERVDEHLGRLAVPVSHARAATRGVE